MLYGSVSTSLTCLWTHYHKSRRRRRAEPLNISELKYGFPSLVSLPQLTCTFSATSQKKMKPFFHEKKMGCGHRKCIVTSFWSFWPILPCNCTRSSAWWQLTVLLCDAIHNKAQERTQRNCVFGATCFWAVTTLSRTLTERFDGL